MAERQGVVVVTGAARGIGRAIAERAARGGRPVVLADCDAATLHTVTTELVAGGANVRGVQCDVSARADVDHLAETAARFGTVDALVNNAGIFPNSPFLEMAEQEFDQVLAVNLKGVFLCSQVFARQMVAGGVGGRIVHISSGASFVGRPGHAAYGTSKAGLNQLTRIMAIELAPYGILVNAVSPGLISSETVVQSIHHPAKVGQHDTKMARIPLARMGEPDEIAEVVEFLIGPGASYITGDVIKVDGGYTCGIARYAATEPAATAASLHA